MDSSPFLTLEGERVGLGPLRLELVALYTQWDSDLALSALRGSSLRPAAHGAGSRTAWFEELVVNKTSVFFTVYETVFEHKAPRPIGVSMLLKIDPNHRTCEFGIYLGERDAWNCGLGTDATRLTLDYAFNALGLHNVLLRVAANNARAVTAYTRAGFRMIGRQRGSYRLGQRALDDFYMDCIATEFESPILEGLWEKTLGR
jgi:diamine N-acetyltransferase